MISSKSPSPSHPLSLLLSGAAHISLAVGGGVPKWLKIVQVQMGAVSGQRGTVVGLG